MNDDNGVMPGIIGQEAGNSGGKIFDNSSLAGDVNIETISFSADGQEQRKPVKNQSNGNFFTKWQPWAIASLVFLVSAAIAIVILIISYEGRIRNSESIAEYISLSDAMNNAKTDFNNKYQELVKDAYGASSTPGNNDIYPLQDEISQAKENCLSRQSISTDDVNYVSSLKPSADLLKDGSDISKENARIERILAGFTSAKTNIESCREDVLAPIMKNFDISIGELTTSEHVSVYGNDYLDVNLPISVINKSDKPIRSLSISYNLIDKNGIIVNNRSIYFTSSYTDESTWLGEGEKMTINLYNGYTVNKSEIDTIKSLQLSIRSISGYYAAK